MTARAHHSPNHASRGHTTAKTATRMLGGRWHGTYGTALCPAHDNRRTPALSLADGKAGRLLVHCFAGCDGRSVLAAIHRLAGCGSPPLHRGRSNSASPTEHFAEVPRTNTAGQSRARHLWARGIAITGTLAEDYLRSRAIRGALPDSLRYLPACWHADSGRSMPALLASVTVDDKQTSVLRTYLDIDGNKARVPVFRKLLGSPDGGAVHIVDGSGPLVLAEGVETALSLRDELGEGFAVWATAGTSGMKRLRLPDDASPHNGELIIAFDDDLAGRSAADGLAGRAHAQGWRVKLLAPPDIGDWNDLAKARASPKAVP